MLINLSPRGIAENEMDFDEKPTKQSDFNPYLIEHESDSNSPALGTAADKEAATKTKAAGLLSKGIESRLAKGAQQLSRGITKIDEYLKAPVKSPEGITSPDQKRKQKQESLYDEL
jgi:hypothetical protein